MVPQLEKKKGLRGLRIGMLLVGHEQLKDKDTIAVVSLDFANTEEHPSQSPRTPTTSESYLPNLGSPNPKKSCGGEHMRVGREYANHSHRPRITR